MEQQLTNEEIARVFAMYMPCPVIMGNNNFNQTLVAVGGFNDAGYCYGKLKNDASTSAQFINNFQLLITPLSSITEEDTEQVLKMEETYGLKCVEDIWQQVYYIKYPTFMYLISKGYDMPLYFSPNHWANSKTAIELGIAIENK